MKGKINTVIKHLSSGLSDRNRDIIFMRYGLKDGEKHSFQEIGDIYSITRERVRQLEEISHSKMYAKYLEGNKDVNVLFDEIRDLVDEKGGVMSEDDIFDDLKLAKNERLPLKLILFLHKSLYKNAENDIFKSHWFSQDKTSKIFQSVMKNIHKRIKPSHGVYTEENMINLFMDEFSSAVKSASDTHKPLTKEKSVYWLSTSKKVNRNLVGDWGHVNCEEISLKNINAKAALVLRKNGGPMHFSEIAKKIRAMTDKHVNDATCHNELVRSDRFVLLGRGKYGLSNTVKYTGSLEDMVKDIVKKGKKVNLKELIKEVSKERELKDATIVRFLFDKKKYTRNKDGSYSLATK